MTQTGGMFSRTFMLYFLVPMFGFLLRGFKTGIFWMIVCLFILIYYWINMGNEQALLHFQNEIDVFKPGYYISLAVTGLIFGCIFVIIFGYQSHVLLRRLKTNQEKLEANNKILERTQQKLWESNKELENFAFVASHDLKQPVRTIKSFTQLLKKQLVTEGHLTTENSEYIDFILAGSKDMNRLIQDLLDYACVSNKETFRVESIPMENTLDLVLLQLDDQIKSIDVSFEREPLPIIKGIKSQMKQLLQNLISNALKFRRRDVKTKIKILCESDADYLRFAISDNGLGIKSEKIQSIFQPFTKIHPDAETEGVGLGLATCKKIVENHKGKIWAESVPGASTTFYFTVSKNL